MAADPITAIANAIAEGSKLFYKLLATKRIRHMKAALDAAERYIHVNEGFGDNEKLEDKERDALLRKFRRRFFKFN